MPRIWPGILRWSGREIWEYLEWELREEHGYYLHFRSLYSNRSVYSLSMKLCSFFLVFSRISMSVITLWFYIQWTYWNSKAGIWVSYSEDEQWSSILLSIGHCQYSRRVLHSSVESCQKQLSFVWNLGFISGRVYFLLFTQGILKCEIRNCLRFL